jgi:hypothetical protein
MPGLTAKAHAAIHFEAQPIKQGTKQVPCRSILVRHAGRLLWIGLAPLLLTAMQREASLEQWAISAS